MPLSRISLRRSVAALTLTLTAAFAAPARAQDAADASADAAADALAAEIKGSSGPNLSGLRLSGFADFTYAKYWFTEESGMRGTFGKDASLYVGNMNLYLDAQLSARVRSLIEVRFTYLPNGAPKYETTDTGANFTRTDSGALDYTDLYRSRSVGSIIVERAWLEYRFHDLFTLRGGQFLTPYGIWNVDHGSPAIVGVLRPFIIGQQLFPESQSGLEAYGSRRVGGALLGYHLTFSNGRIGTHGAYQAVNGRPGFGGRLFAETSFLGDLRVGLSGYRGRYTDDSYEYTMAGVTRTITQQYDEFAIGADLHWVFQGLLVNAEYVTNSIEYKAGKPTHADGVTPIDSDRRWGTYVMAGYALPFARQIMPFVMHEFYRGSEETHHEAGFSTADIYKWTVGVNAHVLPNLVLKAQYGNVERKGKNPYHMADGSSEVFGQAAWAF